MATVTAAAAGRKFTTTVGANKQEIEMEVAPGCGTGSGAWYCITHDAAFPNQLAKDGHIERGEHELAWICLEHGPEVP